MLYGGPLDGLQIGADSVSIRFVLPVNEQPNAIYEASPEWSAHFGKRVAIPAGFPGRPPKQLQEA